jgi:hypothetical protein
MRKLAIAAAISVGVMLMPENAKGSGKIVSIRTVMALQTNQWVSPSSQSLAGGYQTSVAEVDRYYLTKGILGPECQPVPPPRPAPGPGAPYLPVDECGLVSRLRSLGRRLHGEKPHCMPNCYIGVPCTCCHHEVEVIERGTFRHAIYANLIRYNLRKATPLRP